MTVEGSTEAPGYMMTVEGSREAPGYMMTIEGSMEEAHEVPGTQSEK